MREITDDEIRHYREHGVVHLPDLLDRDSVTRVAEAFKDVMFADPPDLVRLDAGELAGALAELGIEPLARTTGPVAGRFEIRTFNWQRFETLAALGCSAPMPAVAARLMGSTRINFFGEQAFLKEAGSIHRTAFHQDAPYFHVTGDQVCTIWMPLDVVDAENAMMGYVRGSHRWDVHAANTFVSQAPIPGSTLPPLPDIEGDESRFDIVYYPARPGDAIVHHVRTVHGSTGNTSTTRDRRALALRFAGDDVRYLWREGAPPDTQASPSLTDGDLLDSDEFPLVWTVQDGYIPRAKV